MSDETRIGKRVAVPVSSRSVMPLADWEIDWKNEVVSATQFYVFEKHSDSSMGADETLAGALHAARDCVGTSEDLCHLIAWLDREVRGIGECDDSLWATPEAIIAFALDAIIVGRDSISLARERLRRNAERIVVPIPPDTHKAWPQRSITEVTAHETALGVAEYLVDLVWHATDSAGFENVRTTPPNRAERWASLNVLDCAERLPAVCGSLVRRLPQLDGNDLAASCEREAYRAIRSHFETSEPSELTTSASTGGWRFDGRQASYSGSEWIPLPGRRFHLLKKFVAKGSNGLTSLEIEECIGTELTDSRMYTCLSELRSVIRKALPVTQEEKIIKRIAGGHYVLTLR